MQRGQSSIAAILLTGGISLAVSAIGAWATASGTISDVKQNVAVISERENNHYLELQGQLSDIKSDVKELLRRTK